MYQYVYKQFRDNAFLGVLDNVKSIPKTETVINTAGSQLEIVIGKSFAETDSTVNYEILVTENADDIITSDGEEISTESSTVIDGVPSLNDKIELWQMDNSLVSTPLFVGFVSKISAGYKDDTVTLTVLSYGARLDNYLVQILPQDEVASHGIVNYNAYDVLYTPYKTPQNRIVGVAQSFQVLADTTISMITVQMLNDNFTTIPLTLNLYAGTPEAPGSLLSTINASVDRVNFISPMEFAFALGVPLTGGTDYYFEILNASYGVGETGSVLIGYDSDGGYSSGARYTYNDSTGFSAASGDLIFSITSSTGSIGSQFLSYDPSDIVTELLDNFGALCDGIYYDSSTIDTTNTVVSYTFKFNTYLEAINKCLELAPANWYWFVDPGTGMLTFKPKPGTVSHTFICGKHLSDFLIEQSLENVVNLAYLSGGLVGSTNLLESAYNSASITKYGQWLERKSDNRVTDTDSAGIIVNNIVGQKSEPKFVIPSITIPTTVYDTTTLVVGQLIGFANFNDLVNSLQLQIMSITRTPDYVTLKLEDIPPTQPKRIEDIKRNLQAQETENNPTII